MRRLFVVGFAADRLGPVVSPRPPGRRWWAVSVRCPETRRVRCPARRPDPGRPWRGCPWCCGGVV
ncbi:MAG TPA: hypothetical protein VHI11_10425, partial [Jiangellaceae bacterium]|nr:hypothetical protein [Jiangellaceae bacterium]